MLAQQRWAEVVGGWRRRRRMGLPVTRTDVPRRPSLARSRLWTIVDDKQNAALFDNRRFHVGHSQARLSTTSSKLELDSSNPGNPCIHS